MRNAPLDAVVDAQPGRQGEARLLDVVANADDAPVPQCPVFGTCGGCQLQSTSLERQRRHKQSLVERLVGFPSHPVEGAAAAYGYRNKLELGFSTQAFHPEHAVEPSTGPAHLGLHPPGWYAKVVPITGCPLASARMNEVIATVAALGLGPGWDARAHTGQFRHLVVREGTGLVVTLVTTSSAEPSEVARAGRAIAAVDGVSGVLHVVNDGVSDVAIGAPATACSREAPTSRSPSTVSRSSAPPRRVLPGQHRGGGAPLRARRRGARHGRHAARPLLRERGDRSRRRARVRSRDRDRSARAVGRTGAANAERNGVRGAWYAGTVEDLLPTISLDRPLAVVVDPPRAGLHPRAVAHLAGLSADTLVYVACNPASLGRDRAVLEGGGWRMTDLWSVDLFPQTPHVEAIGRFVR